MLRWGVTRFYSALRDFRPGAGSATFPAPVYPGADARCGCATRPSTVSPNCLAHTPQGALLSFTHDEMQYLPGIELAARFYPPTAIERQTLAQQLQVLATQLATDAHQIFPLQLALVGQQTACRAAARISTRGRCFRFPGVQQQPDYATSGLQRRIARLAGGFLPPAMSAQRFLPSPLTTVAGRLVVKENHLTRRRRAAHPLVLTHLNLHARGATRAPELAQYALINPDPAALDPEICLTP